MAEEDAHDGDAPISKEGVVSKDGATELLLRLRETREKALAVLSTLGPQGTFLHGGLVQMGGETKPFEVPIATQAFAAGIEASMRSDEPWPGQTEEEWLEQRSQRRAFVERVRAVSAPNIIWRGRKGQRARINLLKRFVLDYETFRGTRSALADRHIDKVFEGLWRRYAPYKTEQIDEEVWADAQRAFRLANWAMSEFKELVIYKDGGDGLPVVDYDPKYRAEKLDALRKAYAAFRGTDDRIIQQLCMLREIETHFAQAFDPESIYVGIFGAELARDFVALTMPMWLEQLARDGYPKLHTGGRAVLAAEVLATYLATRPSKKHPRAKWEVLSDLLAAYGWESTPNALAHLWKTKDYYRDRMPYGALPNERIQADLDASLARAAIAWKEWRDSISLSTTNGKRAEKSSR